MSRILLIDADIVVFRFSHVNQHAFEFDANTWGYYGDFARAKIQVQHWLDEVVRKLDATEAWLYLSDPENNWRHDLLPSYKGHRASWRKGKRPALGELPEAPGPARPMLHRPLRDWMLEELHGTFVNSLEADDLLGIALTEPHKGQERICVTADKDLRTVPGKHFNPDRGEEGVTIVDEREADYNHLYLTLVGDTADGYKGCHGVGPVNAKKLLDAECSWDTVVRAYEKSGSNEADALMHARVARVCRDTDYNPKTGEIKLWTPS